MNEQPKFKWSLENLLNAQQTLERFIALPIANDRDRAGIIQAFEYTFELAWKTLPTPLALVQNPSRESTDGGQFLCMWD